MWKERARRVITKRAWVVFVVLPGVVIACAAIAVADEVTSKGITLHGKITAVSGSGITFEPDFGKGSLTIKWEDIEDLKTDGPFQILHAGGETDAPLQGFANGALLVGESSATATPIDIKTLHSGVPLGAGGLTFVDRMRSYWRYWDGSFDVGFNLQQATTNTTGLLIAFNTVRTNDPTKLTLAASYRYATQKEQGQSSTTIQDQALGLIRGDYNFTPRVYGFASGDAMYDAIQRLSIRGVPKAGLGYVVYEEKLDEDRRNFLNVEAGPSWVYEKYFGGSNRNYFAVAFGVLAGYYLPFGSHFDFRFDYLPAVDNWTTEYLLRAAAALTLPVINPISAKLTLLDEYSTPPAPGAKRNSLVLTFGLSLVW